MFNITYRLALVGLLLLTVGMATGCPGGKSEETPPQTITTGQPPAKPGEPAPPAKPADPKSPVATGDATAPPPPVPSVATPNEHPSGDTWVYTANLIPHIGQKLIVEYKLTKADPGKAWIGLVPDSITATDAPANAAAAVAHADTVAAASATINLDTPRTGTYHLRLFDGKDATAKLLGESPVVKVDQWPQGNIAMKKPPYVTINPVPYSDHVQVQMGFPVVAYFEVPAGYSDKAWLGVVPADTKSPLQIDNDAVALTGAVLYLSGKTKDQYTWKPDKMGTYVFRLFPSSDPGVDYVAQSEVFTIIPKGTPPGKEPK